MSKTLQIEARNEVVARAYLLGPVDRFVPGTGGRLGGGSCGRRCDQAVGWHISSLTEGSDSAVVPLWLMAEAPRSGDVGSAPSRLP